MNAEQVARTLFDTINTSGIDKASSYLADNATIKDFLPQMPTLNKKDFIDQNRVITAAFPDWKL